MPAIQSKLSRNGVYILLIPLFFVLHGFFQNFGLITVADCLLLLGAYWLCTALLYGLCWLLYRNPLKAALLTGVLISFFLFFGAITDFFKAHVLILSKYSVLLPLFFIIFVSLLWYLKKTTANFYKLTFFANILLLIYLLVDISGIWWKAANPDADKLSVYGGTKANLYKPCDSCKTPDIYFLLFDEYASSSNLQQTFNYNNSSLDSFLQQKGFLQPAYSKSNYNFTPFSMASILNMNYISGIKNKDACTIEDYAKCNNLIRNNEVIRFLSSKKYEIVNYSIFDLAGNPSIVHTSLLPVKTRLITEQTLFNRMVRDIGWNLFSGKFKIKSLARNLLYENLDNNNRILSLLQTESARSATAPRFVYAHFEMPHPPFYFDKNGNPRSEEKLVEEQFGEHIESYKEYLPYTNSKLKELVSTIQKNTAQSAIIILMGDHGLRAAISNKNNDHYFENLNAVYFPGNGKQEMPDSVSGVNQFRFILNKVFGQSLPLLKDSSIFLTDQHGGNY